MHRQQSMQCRQAKKALVELTCDTAGQRLRFIRRCNDDAGGIQQVDLGLPHVLQGASMDSLQVK
jgi:hypothetical protein